MTRRGPVAVTSQGWSQTCYHRWLRAGRPESGPPAPLTGEELRQRLSELAKAQKGRKTTVRRFRLRHFAQLRKDRPTMPLDWYADRVGVNVRTILRYRHDLDQVSA